MLTTYKRQLTFSLVSVQRSWYFSLLARWNKIDFFGTRCVTVWVCILQVLPPAGRMEMCHLSEKMIRDRNISLLKIIRHINGRFCPLWASYAYHMSRPAAVLYFKRRVRKLEAYTAVQNISNILESWKQDSTINLYLWSFPKIIIPLGCVQVVLRCWTIFLFPSFGFTKTSPL